MTMAKKDPRIDAYIAKAQPFAKPILKHLRGVVHEGCPQCEETIKWGMPAFTHNGIVAIIASFKAHCAFVLWKADDVTSGLSRTAMGNLGRITSVEDLPPRKTLVGYVAKRAMLNEKGVKRAKPAAARSTKPIRVPAELASALAKNAKARAAWEKFPPSHRREYAEWIGGAKQAETKERRLKAALKQIAEGKPQNWKYMKK
jgi:uncharacterized protein YdeI (YjbR/CyaY-like superfamily)